MEKIIGIGNALVDVLAQIGDDKILSKMELPKGSMQLVDEAGMNRIGQEMKGLTTKCVAGGSAANTIKALAEMGEKPGFIGKIAKDEFGGIFSDACKKSGIKTSFIYGEGATGVASTFISTDGQRTFGTYLGVAAQMEAKEIRPEMLEGYQYLYVEGYLVQNHPLILQAMQTAKAAGMKVCLDLASYNIVEADHDFFEEILNQYVDIVFANEEESKAFTGVEPREALDRLAAICEIAVVKVGAKGAYAKRGEEVGFCEAVKVEKVVDTTGAGDFFAGGFLYGLVHGASLSDCLHVGSVLASEVIQVVGTTLDAETWRGKCGNVLM